MKQSRSLSAVAVLAPLSILLAACGTGTGEGSAESGGGGGGDSTTLTYASYGGTFESGQVSAWQEPYSAENPGVTFANTSPSDTAMIKAQVESGSVQWDLADVNPFFAAEYCGELVEPLELPDVDTSQFDEALVGECYFGAYQFALVISYNTDKWPDPATAPQTVADFFDTEKFPGQRGVVNDVTNGMLEYGLLADGVAPEELYPMDVDRALAKWDTIRDQTTFAANNGAMLQLATGNQVDMMMLVSARTKASLDEGAPFQPIWDNTMVTFHTLVVPKGAPNKDQAMDFIASVLEPEPGAAFAEAAGVSPTNQESVVELDENATTVNAFDDEVNTGGLITTDAEWWGENVTDVSDQFNTWLNG